MIAPRPWLAALLSFVETPLGLMYSGRPQFALAYWLLVQVLYVTFSVVVATGKLNAPALIAIIFALLVVRFAAPFAAWRMARRPPEGRRWFQRWPGLLLLFVLIEVFGTSVVTLNRAFVLEAFRVPGRAMATTINLEDRIFVDKLFCRAADVKRGDIVAYQLGHDGAIFVSRVVALEGDTISLKDNTLRLNGEVVSEPYASYHEVPYVLPELEDTLVPPNHFFVLGDNRNFSSDSRRLGPIALGDYRGRPTNIFFSRHYISIDAEDSRPVHTLGPVAWSRIGKNITR